MSYCKWWSVECSRRESNSSHEEWTFYLHRPPICGPFSVIPSNFSVVDSKINDLLWLVNNNSSIVCLRFHTAEPKRVKRRSKVKFEILRAEIGGHCDAKENAFFSVWLISWRLRVESTFWRSFSASETTIIAEQLFETRFSFDFLMISISLKVSSSASIKGSFCGKNLSKPIWWTIRSSAVA